ncbi:hypothetical protein P8452_03897 [Trifolium repens]|nr:hypothetical protein P8452_03897 [Trifolium repens]
MMKENGSQFILARQELVARPHHRGVIRKRLVPLRFQDNDGEGVSSTLVCEDQISDLEKKILCLSSTLICEDQTKITKRKAKYEKLQKVCFDFVIFNKRGFRWEFLFLLVS